MVIVGFVLPEFRNIVYLTIEVGEYFGTIDIDESQTEFIKCKRHFTAMALNNCEMMTFPLTNLKELKDKFPSIFEEIMENNSRKFHRVLNLKRNFQALCKKTKLVGTLRTATTLTMNKAERTLNKHQVMKEYKKMSIIEEEIIEDSESIKSSFKDSSISEIAKNENNNVPDLIESINESVSENEDEEDEKDEPQEEEFENNKDDCIKYENRLKTLEEKVENLSSKLENIDKCLSRSISTILNKLSPKVEQ